MIRKTLAPLAIVLVFAALPLTASPAGEETALGRVTARLAADPVFVWAALEARPAATWDGVLAMVERFLPPEDLAEMRGQLEGLDEKLGLSLRDDVLAQLGPELVVSFDLPVFDAAMGQVMSGQASGQQILDGIGVLAGVRDAAKLEASVRHLFSLGEAKIGAADGLTRVRFPTGAAAGAPAEAAASPPMPVEFVDLFFATKDGLFALGFSSEWVRGALSGRPAQDRLTAGADFQRVFAQLDAKPETLTYFNVPKIVERIKGSQMISGMLAASEEARPMLELLDTPELTSLGVGSTTVSVAGGRRTTAFGPPALAGGGVQAGIVAAVLVPNFLDALQKAKQKRTVADLRMCSKGLMGYATDRDGRFPGPTAGWVPLASLESALVPTYLVSLPINDGWGHAYQYQSDGSSFRLASPGRDGVFAEDLAGEVASGPVEGYDGDILLVDGYFVRYPESAPKP